LASLLRTEHGCGSFGRVESGEGGCINAIINAM